MHVSILNLNNVYNIAIHVIRFFTTLFKFDNYQYMLRECLVLVATLITGQYMPDQLKMMMIFEGPTK